MNNIYLNAKKAVEIIKKDTDFVPETALVLGSGLGDFADTMDIAAKVPYSSLPGFPVSTVSGHEGQFILGYIDGVPVVAMQGRIHYYEGYDMEEVVLPSRVMRLMGAKVFFVTNAAGGVNFDFSAGDLMLIDDQISSFVPSPLRGENIDELGTRFPDMSHIYSKRLSDIVRSVAKAENIPLQHGVYLQTQGPNFETPAEIRMYRTLGADAVGMSTACETISAVHMGMEVVGISVISNLACGMTDNPLTHEEVKETANITAPLFKKLVRNSIIEIHKAIN